MTNTTNRLAPEGYTDEYDSTLWNVGFIFRWSPVYEAWLACGRCTVKPGQTVREAYEAWADEPMWNDYFIFFSSNM